MTSPRITTLSLVLAAATACAGVPRPGSTRSLPALASAARVTAPPTVASGAPPFDPGPWQEDLRALIAALSSHYANLDFAVHVRRMNLVRLRAQAEARIASATTDDEARRTLLWFLKSFGDGHLVIRWPSAHAAAAPDTGPLCQRLGYAAAEPGGIDFGLVGGFTPTEDADARDLPGGMLRVPGRGKLGVLRIGVFAESAHPALCEAARVALGLSNDSPCDDACADRLERAVSNRLTAALARRALSLARAGAAAVAVDITGNGGGTSWYDPAARVLTPVPLTQHDFAVVRHAHWVRQLSATMRDLEADLAAHGEIVPRVLASAIETLHAEIEQVSTPCDTSALWQSNQAALSCQPLVRIRPALRYAKPGALTGRPVAAALFGASDYEYTEGVNVLPLVVLVDGGTASAAEGFVEALQDSRAATVVGAPTYGAGCGYTGGGISTVLPRSHATVGVPDCVRLRADGTNAVAQ